MFHRTGIALESARRRASLDTSPKRVSMFTDTRPNSTTKCWQIWYFVLIEREARPHPDLITSLRPSVPPSLNLSFSVLPCPHKAFVSPESGRQTVTPPCG